MLPVKSSKLTAGLVSDELMLAIVKKELERHRGKSWILDGFPRTLEQGKLLSAELGKAGRPLNMVMHLNVPDSVIMSRIAGEWRAGREERTERALAA